MKKFFNQQFNLIFLLIILFELISFAGYLFPIVNAIAFFVLIILVLITALYKLEYGLAILLTELFIGSKGYLFYFTFEETIISFRIALWLIIMSVWIGKTIADWIKNKKLSLSFCKSSFFSYFIVLFIFIILGLINGLIKHNQFDNLFFDFNAWLYFLLIFPVYEILRHKKNIQLIGKIFIASCAWLMLETLFLLFAFSHNLIIALFVLYGWIRDTGVGEITQVQSDFFRIFFQSHIFILALFFFASINLTKLAISSRSRRNLNLLIINLALAILSLTTILISFSRSYWLGLVCGALVCWIVWLFIIKIKFKQFLLINYWWLLTIAASIILIIAIVRFPYPSTPVRDFNAVNLFSNRAGNLAGEAGVLSRWALLPKLWAEIIKAPFFGQGFGATVSYQTKDPRVLELNPTGKYTTYAFEWGWLDIWLKLGFFGLLAYLSVIIKISLTQHKQNWLILSLIIGLTVITITSISSPYFNHPLGIGYIILSAAVIDYYLKK